jgi:hypothetical protein
VVHLAGTSPSAAYLLFTTVMMITSATDGAATHTPCSGHGDLQLKKSLELASCKMQRASTAAQVWHVRARRKYTREVVCMELLARGQVRRTCMR